MTRMKASDGDSDWDFPNARTSAYTHGLHPYPARMVPDIVSRLLMRYSDPGDTVYDPFCGSGTTLVESTLHDRHAIGLDLNPLAVLLTKAKTRPIDPELLQDEWNSLKRYLLHPLARERGSRAREAKGKLLDLKYWYKPYVRRDLGFIRALLDDFYPDGDDPIGDFIRIAFARTAREVSNHRPSEFKRWRRSAEELRTFRPRPVKRMVENVEKAIPMMAAYYRAVKGHTTCRVLRVDARKFRLASPASLIITSPPYGDSRTTVAYGQFSSFGLEWLGLYDGRLSSLDKHPLGAANNGEGGLGLSDMLSQTYEKVKSGDPKRARHMLQFFEGMAEALTNIRRSLESSRYCCMVVGNRRIRGIEVPTDAIITEFAEALGFQLEDMFVRTLQKKVLPYATKPLNVSGDTSVQPTLRNETILVLRNT